MNEELVQYSVMNKDLIQNRVMNEELVQSVVMNEKFVKSFVMNAKIDPKVVMDLSPFNSLQPIKQKFLEEFIDENEPWLLIGIPSRDPFLVTHYLETTLCEFRSAHEEIDVTSWRSSYDDAMLHATALH